jgi:hypothetical protein
LHIAADLSPQGNPLGISQREKTFMISRFRKIRSRNAISTVVNVGGIHIQITTAERDGSATSPEVAPAIDALTANVSAIKGMKGRLSANSGPMNLAEAARVVPKRHSPMRSVVWVQGRDALGRLLWLRVEISADRALMLDLFSHAKGNGVTSAEMAGAKGRTDFARRCVEYRALGIIVVCNYVGATVDLATGNTRRHFRFVCGSKVVFDPPDPTDGIPVVDMRNVIRTAAADSAKRAAWRRHQRRRPRTAERRGLATLDRLASAKPSTAAQAKAELDVTVAGRGA